MNISTRIYIFNGFLDSGKTSFINDTIYNTDFCYREKTVIVVSEEGEEAFDAKQLRRYDCYVEYVEMEEDLDEDFFNGLKKKYHPTQVFIELNGMYDTQKVIDVDKPKGWEVVQIITTINSKTFTLYVNNMRSLVYSQVVNSDMVILNRMDETMKKSFYRNTLKSINGNIQIMYENEDGSMNETEDEELPYDIESDYLDVLDHDFGIFCYDTLDHPERYDKKTIKIRGIYLGQDQFINNGFVLGRQAMVCCEQDTKTIGLICVHQSCDQLIPGEWIEVEGQLNMRFDEEYDSNIDVLYVSDINVIQPLANPYVTFD